MSGGQIAGSTIPGSREDGFWALYEAGLPRVFGYLARRTDRSTAEDLTQEVFTTAARTWGTGDHDRVTLPWLLTVAKSRLIDHARSEARRSRNLAAVGARRQTQQAASAEDTAAAARFAPETERALDALPGQQRTALVLHHLDDLSVADVADVLGCSVRAAESLLARARRSFVAAFQEASR